MSITSDREDRLLSCISHYFEKDYKLSEHRLNGLEQSLISEQQMNEILNDENAQLQLDNAKLRENLFQASRHLDLLEPSSTMCKLISEALSTTSQEKVNRNKPDDYNMVLRREDGLHITLDIVNLSITKSGVKQFTLALGETK